MSRKIQFTGRVRGALRSLVPAALKLTGGSGEFPALERDGICARCHRDWPDDPNFPGRYADLIARNPSATIFNSLAWQTAVVNEFVPAGQFRLITVERDSRLLAVLPLALNTSSMLETPGRWLTDYLDPPIDPHAATETWSIILDMLNDLWDWSLGGVQLNHVRTDAELRRILPELAPKSGFDYSETPGGAAPYINLPGSWDEYLNSLSAHDRKEIKRKLRNAQTKGSLRWLTLRTEEEAIPALERAMSAMRQSESSKADFTDEILIGFLRRVVPDLIRLGEFHIHELWLENNPAGWLLCMNSPRGPMIYNTSYDFAQRQWSPGVVCFSLAINDAIAQGASVFNLLRGAEEYKKRLGAKDLELVNVQLLPN